MVEHDRKEIRYACNANDERVWGEIEKNNLHDSVYHGNTKGLSQPCLALPARTLAVSLDSIPTFLPKLCFNELRPIITYLVNLSISEGIFPSSFKQAFVEPCPV